MRRRCCRQVSDLRILLTRIACPCDGAIGPKFALPPRLQPIDKVALVRNIASKAQDESASRIISEGIDCIASQRSSAKVNRSFGTTIHELISKELKLCVSDMEGGFVVLDSDAYEEKAAAAMAKNFIQVEV